MNQNNIKSDNFCYRKVGRAITIWGATEKIPILLSQYWKTGRFVCTKNYWRLWEQKYNVNI